MPDFPMPHMPEAECNALTNALRGANTYLEFGMGGSTTLAARMGVPNVISVDSSKEWIDSISSQISQIEQTGRIQLLHANLGETGAWGYPIDSNNIANWPSYYTGAWAAVRAKGVDPDLVLIDGRFRIPCFLYSLLHLKGGATILWDDYKPRPEYHLIEKHLKPIEFYGGMAAFKVQNDMDVAAIVSSLFENLYDLG